jgi:hypothetical protein
MAQEFDSLDYMFDLNDLPTHSTLLAIELRLVNPKLPGQDTLHFNNLSWKAQANRKVFHVECDSRYLAEIKRLNAQVKLQLDAIELKKKRGELVDKRQVYTALFEAGQTIKNQVLGVPDRILDEMLAASSRNEAHTILYKALVQALEALADTNKITLPE